MISSTTIVAAGAYVVRRSAGPLVPGVGVLDLVALFVGLSTLMLVLVIRSRLPARAGGASDDDWWRANASRAILVWALLELPAILAAITLFATGHVVVFAVLAGYALAGLGMLSPARLAGG
ncbi:MAG TPA: hypothetical protein VGQ17_16665 [Gemmatimonadales bacterium]|jgi:hypothetical protein|nr:hypothetical protein [Gemmatimonadales bacterium]